jgi:hypothetical protein
MTSAMPPGKRLLLSLLLVTGCGALPTVVSLVYQPNWRRESRFRRQPHAGARGA